MNRRGTLAAVLVLALLWTGGCTILDPAPRLKSDSTAAPSPTAKDAREELLEALHRTQEASYRFRVRGSLPKKATVDGTGAFDRHARLLDLTFKITGDSPTDGRRIAIGHDLYTRSRGSSYWVHLDMSRVQPSNTLIYVNLDDPTGLVKFTSTIMSVVPAGPHRYTGEFDPESEFKPFVPIGVPSVSVFTFGAANSLTGKFTATTNDQGWVTSISIDLNADGQESRTTTTLSDHGAKLPIKAPPKSQVREADESYYAGQPR